MRHSDRIVSFLAAGKLLSTQWLWTMYKYRNTDMTSHVQAWNIITKAVQFFTNVFTRMYSKNGTAAISTADAKITDIRLQKSVAYTGCPISMATYIWQMPQRSTAMFKLSQAMVAMITSSELWLITGDIVKLVCMLTEKGSNYIN